MKVESSTLEHCAEYLPLQLTWWTLKSEWYSWKQENFCSPCVSGCRAVSQSSIDWMTDFYSLSWAEPDCLNKKQFASLPSINQNPGYKISARLQSWSINVLFNSKYLNIPLRNIKLLMTIFRSSQAGLDLFDLVIVLSCLPSLHLVHVRHPAIIVPENIWDSQSVKQGRKIKIKNKNISFLQTRPV